MSGKGSDRNIFVLAVMAVAVFAALALGLPLIVDINGNALSRDFASTAELPWWVGSLSMVALMMWSGAAGVCALAAAVIAREDPEQCRFLATTAALLLLAAFDDALQLHEVVGPVELGVSEEVCYAVLGAVVALWALRFRSQIFATRLWLLAGAAILFSGSLFSDFFEVGATAAEDWLKNSGIAIVVIWCFDTSLYELRLRRGTTL
jgi:hypothetical protein